MVDENIEEKILDLYSQGKWRDIVNLDCISSEFEKCRLFWVLPTINDLNWIKKIIDKHCLIGLASIGCGCGLLEWLFREYSAFDYFVQGLDAIGIELDRSWWRSKYSPPLFLENIFFVQENNIESLCLSEKYALLFCYFNNALAFCDYVANYKGKLIFVIGPEEGQHRFTDPMPFDTKFHETLGLTFLWDKKGTINENDENEKNDRLLCVHDCSDFYANYFIKKNLKHQSN